MSTAPTHLPLPIKKETLLLKRSQSFLMAFHNPTPYLISHFMRMPPPFNFPIFSTYNLLPESPPFQSKTLTPLA